MSSSGSGDDPRVISARTLGLGWVFELRWLTAIGGWARRLLRNPVRTVQAIVAVWFIDSFVTPIVGAIIGTGQLFINAILLLFFGGDYRFGSTGQFGLADFGLYLWRVVTTSLTASLFSLVTAVRGFNQSLAQIGAEAGIAAPIIVTALYIVELAIGLWAIWFVIRAVDIPVINLGPILSGLAAPFRFILGVFQ